MATTISKTIKPSGGDYTSFSGWLAANGGATSADLVTNDEALVLTVYKGDYTSLGGGVNYISEDVSINQFTTDSTRNITIQVASGEEHGGIIDDGMIIRRSSANTGFNIQDQYVTVDGFQLEHGGSQAYHVATSIGSGGQNSKFINCIIRLTNASPAGNVCNIGVDNAYYINNLIDGGGTSGIGISNSSYCLGYSYNNTIIDCAYGVRGPSVDNQNLTVINTVTWGCTKFHYDVDTRYYESASGYNASSTYTTQATIDEVGSTSYTSNVVTGDFSDTSTDDYHLASGSNLIGIGTSLSGTFTDDVDGDTRSSWDIGFDEYTAYGTDVLVDQVELLINTHAATITTTSGIVNVDLGTLSLTTYPAIVTATTGDTGISVNLGTLTITEYPASIDYSIAGDSVALTLTEYPATVTLTTTGNTVFVDLGALTITPHAASIDFVYTPTDVEVSAGTDTLTISAYAASITATPAIWIDEVKDTQTWTDV